MWSRAAQHNAMHRVVLVGFEQGRIQLVQEPAAECVALLWRLSVTRAVVSCTVYVMSSKSMAFSRVGVDGIELVRSYAASSFRASS